MDAKRIWTVPEGDKTDRQTDNLKLTEYTHEQKKNKSGDSRSKRIVTHFPQLKRDCHF